MCPCAKLASTASRPAWACCRSRRAALRRLATPDLGRRRLVHLLLLRLQLRLSDRAEFMGAPWKAWDPVPFGSAMCTPEDRVAQPASGELHPMISQPSGGLLAERRIG